MNCIIKIPDYITDNNMFHLLMFGMLVFLTIYFYIITLSPFEASKEYIEFLETIDDVEIKVQFNKLWLYRHHHLRPHDYQSLRKIYSTPYLELEGYVKNLMKHYPALFILKLNDEQVYGLFRVDNKKSLIKKIKAVVV